jgi:hypothetical protein
MHRPSRGVCRVLCLAWLLAWPFQTWAATVYVALTGADTNPGTEAEPFATLPRAYRGLTPGDAVYVRAGVYAKTGWYPPSATSWEQPILISGYPDETVIFKDAGRFQLRADTRYVIFRDMTWDHTGFHAGPSADHIRLQRLVVKNGTGTATLGGACEACEFLDLTVHDNGRGTLDHSLYMASDDGLVEGGTWANTSGFSLHLKGRDDGTGPQPDGWTIRGVTFANERPDTLDQRGAIYAQGTGHRLYNNVFRKFQCGAVTLHAAGSQVWHNTFDGNGHPVSGHRVNCRRRVTGDLRSGAPYLDIRNNLFTRSGNRFHLHLGQATGHVISHNLTDAPALKVHPEAAPLATETIVGAARETMYRDPGTAHDYRLRLESPACDSAVPLPLTYDFLARVPPQGLRPDRGAYEFTWE